MDTHSLYMYVGWGVALLSVICLIVLCIIACRKKRRSETEIRRGLREVEVVRTEYQRAQQSLEDYEEEKQLLLSRLKNGGFECHGALRACLRELQLHLAAAEASNKALQDAFHHKPQKVQIGKIHFNVTLLNWHL